MRYIVMAAWPLFLGMILLQIGNGMQGTVLGIRGAAEGFSTSSMSLVMSGYFLGFLAGSRLAPPMIRRVGHVRVFAALGSMISALLIMYPLLVDPFAWGAGRVLLGFCFSGVYVTAESWLNNSVDNANRGKALSIYLIAQMAAMVAAQWVVTLGDPAAKGDFAMFVVPSILVSLAFAPILLTVSPAPAFETSKPLSISKLFRISPLGCVGTLFLGGVFSVQFGMSSVFATSAGFSVREVSIFISAFFVGALVCQYPIGWLSDRVDRRMLIMVAGAGCGLGGLLGYMLMGSFPAMVASALIAGGMANPLYSLLIAHTNDYLDRDDMAGAAGGLIFINGCGAVVGPVLLGWWMEQQGPQAFFAFIFVFGFMISGYAAWRTTRRAATPVAETESYTVVAAGATPTVMEIAIETAQEEAASEQTAADGAGR